MNVDFPDVLCCDTTKSLAVTTCDIFLKSDPQNIAVTVCLGQIMQIENTDAKP